MLLFPAPMMLHIKFDEDWPIGQFISVDDRWTAMDGGSLLYYKCTMWAFGSGELQMGQIYLRPLLVPYQYNSKIKLFSIPCVWHTALSLVDIFAMKFVQDVKACLTSLKTSLVFCHITIRKCKGLIKYSGWKSYSYLLTIIFKVITLVYFTVYKKLKC